MVNYYNSGCPYKNCRLNCINFTQHRARYANIKRRKSIDKQQSSRINYDVLKKMQESWVPNLKNNQ